MHNLIQNQATLNIGTIGHVAHGKSTLVHSISGTSTIKYKSELERNITIKLGYANAKIYECTDPECPRPDKYSSLPSNAPSEVPCVRRGCNGISKLIKHISFVDCPGHDVLMATMLTGTAIMDAALLLVAANVSCPQPQTQEHLCAVEIMDLSSVLIVQNKIDLVSREQAIEQRDQIKEFIKGKKVSEANVVPVSSQLGVNVDAVLDFIVNYMPVPHRNYDKDPKMVIIRSFDINKPGVKIDQVKGGVLGGSLIQGRLKIGDEIEIRPGIVSRENGRIVCRPFVTRITSLKAEENVLEEAVPGGLIGVGTVMDPVFCKGDKLVGMVMGLKGKLPPVYIEIEVNHTLFKKINVSVRQKETDVNPLRVKEQILLSIGSTTAGSSIFYVEEKIVKFLMVKPACCEIGERIAMSRKINGHWRLIGYGKVLSGKQIDTL
ncbi:eukaryotic translation initiation factor 2 subunit gamma [Conglomerata obtusa]